MPAMVTRWGRRLPWLLLMGGPTVASFKTAAFSEEPPLSPGLQRVLHAIKGLDLPFEDILEAEGAFYGAMAMEGGGARYLRAPPAGPTTGPSGSYSLCPPCKEDQGFASLKDPGTWYRLLGVLICVMGGATAAGLTLGMLSLDPLDIQLKLRAGRPLEQEYAKKILPIISRHHLLLVSLLLFNAAANETLPLFLDDIVPAYMAIIISVTLVLIFGEIIPSALFTGPRQLQLAAAMAKPTWVIICFFSPLAWPIAKLLDWLLGHEGLRQYTRKELATLMHLQSHEPSSVEGHESKNGPGHGEADDITRCDSQRLTVREADMVNGILEHSHATVANLMIPEARVFSMEASSPIDATLIQQVMEEGYSRIPVHYGSKRNLRGFIHMRKFLMVDYNSQRLTLDDLCPTIPVVVGEDTHVGTLLLAFQESMVHMAFVSKDPVATLHALEEGLPLADHIVGIITLEDVLEALLQQDIQDEKDDHKRRKASPLTKDSASQRLLGALRNMSACRHSTKGSQVSSSNKAQMVDPELVIHRDASVNFLTPGLSKRFSADTTREAPKRQRLVASTNQELQSTPQ